MICNITGKEENCRDCFVCGNLPGNRYGSCFNCRFRHPLMPSSSGNSKRCRDCYPPPQRIYMGMHFNTAILWCSDGGIEIDAISNAIFEMHGTPHNNEARLKAYRRLKEAIVLIESLPWIKMT